MLYEVITQGTHKIEVDIHGLVIALLRKFKLILEAFQLIDGVVQFRIGIANRITSYNVCYTKLLRFGLRLENRFLYLDTYSSHQ